jgi:hypothetical protein
MGMKTIGAEDVVAPVERTKRILKRMIETHIFKDSYINNNNVGSRSECTKTTAYLSMRPEKTLAKAQQGDPIGELRG